MPVVRSLLGRSLGELWSSDDQKRSVTGDSVEVRGVEDAAVGKAVPIPTPVLVLGRNGDPDKSDSHDPDGPDDPDDGPSSVAAATATMTVWVTATATMPASSLLTAPAMTTSALQRGLATASSSSTSAASTVIIPVAVPPPPMDKGGDGNGGMGKGKYRGMSDQTEDILIAVASITGTVLLLVLIYVYLQFRRGRTLMDIIRGPRRRPKSEREDLRGPGGRTWSRPSTWVKPSYEFDASKLPKPAEGVPTRNRSIRELPFPPTPILVRQGTSASNRPLLKETASYQESARSPSTIQSNPMFELPAPVPVATSPSPPPAQRAPDPPQQPNPLTQNPPSVVASSRALPVLQENVGHSSHPSQSTESMPAFIYNSGTASQNGDTYVRNQSKVTIPKVSRFSWTNSQAPQTPRDPFMSRVSVATSTDSIPRFRTVESWVSQQAGRMAERDIKEYFITADSRSEAGSETPSRRQGTSESTLVDNEKVYFAPGMEDSDQRSPMPAMPPIPSELKHERKMTQHSDATVFRQHPGTEIVIPRGSRVPSEVLDKVAGGNRGMI